MAAVRSCGTDMFIHTLTLSDQVLHCHPHLQLPSTVPCMTVLHKPSCCVTWQNHASFCCLTVERRGSCHPMRAFGFVLHIFIGLMLPVGDTKELSQAFILKCLYPTFCLSKECPDPTPIEEDGDDQGFVELELGLEYMGASKHMGVSKNRECPNIQGGIHT